MTTERTNRENVEVRMCALAPQLAAALGEEWRVVVPTDLAEGKPFRHWRRIVHNDGRALSMMAQYPNANKGRIEIYGELPSIDSAGRNHISDMRLDRVSITVSVGRTPQAIAGEVNRRLLPDYATAYAKASEYIAGVNRHLAEQASAATTLARLMGVKAPSQDGRMWLPDDLASYGHMRVDGSSVRMEATFSLEQATAVIRALQALAPESDGADECTDCGARFNATPRDKRPICPRCK